MSSMAKTGGRSSTRKAVRRDRVRALTRTNNLLRRRRPEHARRSWPVLPRHAPGGLSYLAAQVLSYSTGSVESYLLCSTAVSPSAAPARSRRPRWRASPRRPSSLPGSTRRTDRGAHPPEAFGPSGDAR
jgi:hypothetical protein